MSDKAIHMLIATAAFLYPFIMAALMCWLCPVHDKNLRVARRLAKAASS